MSTKSQEIELQLFYSPFYPLVTFKLDQQTSYGSVSVLAMDTGTVLHIIIVSNGPGRVAPITGYK